MGRSSWILLLSVVMLEACGGGGGSSGGGGGTGSPPPALSLSAIVPTATTAVGGVTSISFSATCSGGTAPYSYTWLFGDNASVQTTAGSTSHIFTATGTFTTTASCSDSKGATAQTTGPASITVTAPTPVLSVVQTSPSNPGANTPASFSASCSSPISVPLSFVWTFGDNTPSVMTTAGSTSHTYASAGSYHVSVICTDTMNNVSSAASGLTLAVATPGASISLALAAIGNPTPVIPTTLIVGCSGAGVFTYSWNFGDGSATQTTSSGTVTHLFPAGAGTYSASVQCDDGSGSPATSTASVPVVVPSSSVLAGHPGGSGFANLSGSNARFTYPSGIATDTSGNLYVADFSAIRKIDPTGLVSTFAGSFSVPRGLAMDRSGNLYVVDNSSNTVSVVAPDATIRLLAGKSGTTGSNDGTGANATFDQPYAAAVDSTGNVYVTDSANSTIRMITSAGTVSTIAGTPGSAGFKDGTGAAAQFFYPHGIALDTSGNLFVADFSNCVVRRIAMPGAVVTTIAGAPGVCAYQDGTGNSLFQNADGLVFDGAGNLYVTDGNRVRKIVAGATAALTQVSTVAGSATAGPLDGVAGFAQFSSPSGLALTPSGALAVADSLNFSIRSVALSSDTVSTIAGDGSSAGLVNGGASISRFSRPAQIAADGAGNLFIADPGNNGIRLYSRGAQSVSTLAGSASGTAGSGDGTGTGASFFLPKGIALDAAGNVYVADWGNHTIRKITQPGGTVTTVAGAPGAPGSTDGSGSQARFNQPGALAIDSAGNIYVGQDASCAIRKVTPQGVVTTFAGTAAGCGHLDGQIATAQFGTIAGLAFGPDGSLYVADSLPSGGPGFASYDVIRKIAPSGIVSTLAGGPNGFADGQGAAAQFHAPKSIAVDLNGMIYVADFGNSAVRKISPSGLVQTVAGIPGVSSLVTGNLPGYLNAPWGLAFFGYFDLYVADSAENSVVDFHFYP